MPLFRRPTGRSPHGRTLSMGLGLSLPSTAKAAEAGLGDPGRLRRDSPPVNRGRVQGALVRMGINPPTMATNPPCWIEGWGGSWCDYINCHFSIWAWTGISWWSINPISSALGNTIIPSTTKGSKSTFLGWSPTPRNSACASLRNLIGLYTIPVCWWLSWWWWRECNNNKTTFGNRTIIVFISS